MESSSPQATLCFRLPFKPESAKIDFNNNKKATVIKDTLWQTKFIYIEIVCKLDRAFGGPLVDCHNQLTLIFMIGLISDFIGQGNLKWGFSPLCAFKWVFKLTGWPRRFGFIKSIGQLAIPSLNKISFKIYWTIANWKFKLNINSIKLDNSQFRIQI